MPELTTWWTYYPTQSKNHLIFRSSSSDTWYQVETTTYGYNSAKPSKEAAERQRKRGFPPLQDWLDEGNCAVVLRESLKNPGSKASSGEWLSSTLGLAVRIIEDNQSSENELSATKHAGGQGEASRLNIKSIHPVFMSTISPAKSLIWSVAQKLAEQLERGSSVREVKRVIQAESGGQDFPGNQANIALDNQGLETQGDSSGSEEGHKNMNGSIEKAIQAVRREMEMMFEEAYTTDLGLESF